jgi:FAD/FMN-containing dehydrogenase
LIVADGTIASCSATENPELFRATIGGMGLTGIITVVTFRLIRVETAYIRQETVVAPNLDASMRAFEESKGWTYTVAWIDGLAKGNALGRSLIYRGEHAHLDELDERKAKRPFSAKQPLPLAVPFYLPNFMLSRLTVKAFNAGYYLNGARKEGMQIAGWFPYFFPLDAIADWNRIYGPRGFIQHQCVVPKATSRDAIGEILSVIGRIGSPSFLAVLKLLGPDEDGLMTFPMEGYTLAIDFPVSKKTLELAKELDRIVARYGGRLYLAKDARQDRSMVEMGYPNIEKFRALRRQTGASEKFRSLQSERLGL